MKITITIIGLLTSLFANAAEDSLEAPFIRETYTYTVSSRHSVEMALRDLVVVCRREAIDRGLVLTDITDINIENSFPVFVTGTCVFSKEAL